MMSAMIWLRRTTMVTGSGVSTGREEPVLAFGERAVKLPIADGEDATRGSGVQTTCQHSCQPEL